MSLPLKKLLTESDVQQNRKLFEAVQGYTLVSHGRDHVWLGLVHLDPAVKTAEQRRKFVEMLSKEGAQATPALYLYQSYQDHKAKRDYERDRIIIAVGLASPAYGLFPSGKPDSDAFKSGFKEKFSSVLQPKRAVKDHEDALKSERYAAVIVLAGNNYDEVKKRAGEISKRLDGLAKVDWEEGRTKRCKRNGKNVIKDHFGFQEGISQPVFFDFEDHRTSGWTSGWDPAVGLGCVLTSQPDRRDETEYGSFMAFLKIKQNVGDFKRIVRDTATALMAGQPAAATNPGSEAIDEEAVLAAKQNEVKGQIMGRTPDGEPLTGRGPADLNDFDYAGKNSSRCPISAHIRKVNPRTGHHRNKRILRRGVLYDKGENDRGILFQCFQSDLATGFEYIFGEWVLNEDLPEAKAGKDPLLAPRFSVKTLTAAIAGQAPPKEQKLIVSKLDEMEADAKKAAAGAGQAAAQQRADKPKNDCPAANSIQQATPYREPKEFTEIQAGEYFYFPSIPFFQRLAPPPAPPAGSV